MSNSTAKATRRDLRRAIGPAATEHVREIEQAIGIMQNGLASCQREIATLAINHATLGRGVGQLKEGLAAVGKHAACAYVVTTQRGFLGRLRWLFTGQ